MAIAGVVKQAEEESLEGKAPCCEFRLFIWTCLKLEPCLSLFLIF